VGLNYVDHANESSMKVPEEPILFTKAPNCLVGPYDDVRIPRGATKVDYEVELAVVIGKQCRYLESPEQALEHIAGFTISNDVSEREWQTRIAAVANGSKASPARPSTRVDRCS
jgi:2,4-diketo-3-deoxy-L-fuconate hydrolase